MVWTRLHQQQQRGAQLPTRPGKGQQQAGEAPAEAVAGREVQDHDYADLDVSQTGEPQRDIDYPASDVPNREGDITPSAPEPSVQWDEIVQPERTGTRQEQQGERRDGEGRSQSGDDLPLPEGK